MSKRIPFKDGDKVVTCITSMTLNELNSDLFRHKPGNCTKLCKVIHIIKNVSKSSCDVEYDPETWISENMWFRTPELDSRHGGGWNLRHFRRPRKRIIKSKPINKSFNRLLFL